MSPSRLRDELGTWIDLHLQQGVSGALLILSRAFTFDRGAKEDDANAVIRSLEGVMSSLPENLLNEAELEVDSEHASYKQILEVLQEQEELIEDEAEQEEKEESIKRAKRDKEKARREEDADTSQLASSDSKIDTNDDLGMTNEQLKELAEALLILSSKSSVLKERDELQSLMSENIQSDSDMTISSPLAKRIRTMLTRIDAQLNTYDSRVGSSLQLISCDPHGRISVKDLEQALRVIKHAPGEEVMENIVQKLDVDKDGYVILEHVLSLAKEQGIDIGVDEDARSIIGLGKEIKNSNAQTSNVNAR